MLSDSVFTTHHCKTDIDEARIISFVGVRTDKHDFRIFIIWKHVDTQKISTQYSKLEVSCRSLYIDRQ